MIVWVLACATLPIMVMAGKVAQVKNPKNSKLSFIALHSAAGSCSEPTAREKRAILAQAKLDQSRQKQARQPSTNR